MPRRPVISGHGLPNKLKMQSPGRSSCLEPVWSRMPWLGIVAGPAENGCNGRIKDCSCVCMCVKVRASASLGVSYAADEYRERFSAPGSRDNFPETQPSDQAVHRTFRLKSPGMLREYSSHQIPASGSQRSPRRKPLVFTKKRTNLGSWGQVEIG